MYLHFFLSSNNLNSVCSAGSKCNNGIRDVRYHCAVCENMDFCEACESAMQLHNHPFLIFRVINFNLMN